MIARILGGVCVGLMALSAVQTFKLTHSDRELQAVKAMSAQQSDHIGDLTEKIKASETSRQAEREQCATDFAGEVMRAKAEIEAATKASHARASLTGCRAATTPADRLKALRVNSGERP